MNHPIEIGTLFFDNENYSIGLIVGDIITAIDYEEEYYKVYICGKLTKAYIIDWECGYYEILGIDTDI